MSHNIRCTHISQPSAPFLLDIVYLPAGAQAIWHFHLFHLLLVRTDFQGDKVYVTHRKGEVSREIGEVWGSSRNVTTGPLFWAASTNH